MGKAPDSSDLPTTPNQHGDAATLDVFAELERSGVPVKASKQDSKQDGGETQESAPKRGKASAAQQTPPAQPPAGSGSQDSGAGSGSQGSGSSSPAASSQGSGSQAAEAPAAPAAPQVPSTALLFQPPERPSRRASAPAGPPPSSRDAGSADSDSGSDSDSGARSGNGDERGSGSRKSDGEGSNRGGNGNRSNRGKSQGRNNTSKSDDSADSRSSDSRDDSCGNTRDNSRNDSDGSSQSDASDDSNSSDSNEEGGQRRRRRRGGRGRRGRGGSNGSNGSNDNADSSDSSDSDSSDGSSDSSDSGSNDASDSGSNDGSKSGSGSGVNRSGKSDKNSRNKSSNKGDDKSQSDSGDDSDDSNDSGSDSDSDSGSSSSRRRRRRRRGGSSRSDDSRDDEVATPRGSTRLEAKRQRRREGRETGRRKPIITEAEFLARRESVNRTMMVRERDGRMQIAVLEDDVLVEHYVSRNEDASIAGNVYVGKVQNVLPSMEAAFVDIGKGRNAVLYAGEVNWDAAGLDANEPRRIESALSSGDHVLVQVTKDPIGHKGARLTAQVSLAGRFLVFVPNGSMTGISRKLPDTERARLKKILKDIVPEGGGVIVRTAAEGASEDELRADIERLQKRWVDIEAAQKGIKKSAGPKLVHSEADMAIRVVRDIFNEDFEKLVVSGDEAWTQISDYVDKVAPDLATKLSQWASNEDIFAANRIDEQLAKAMDRKVYLPSGGSLVIDRTEAMTVVDVNTGRFTGTGGTLEETVTKNNLEAAEEVVRQLRLRDIGGIIVIDFIDMVLEQNRDLVMRRLVECLGRDRTKHQVAEVTSLGLVQMTRKRVGQGLVEAFSEKCEHCAGRGFITHDEPVEKDAPASHGSHGGESKSGDKQSNNDSKSDSNKSSSEGGGRRNNRRRRKDSADDASHSGSGKSPAGGEGKRGDDKGADETESKDGTEQAAGSNDAVPSETPEEVRAALAAIAAAAVQSHERKGEESTDSEPETN